MITFIKYYSNSAYPFWDPRSGAIGGIKVGACVMMAGILVAVSWLICSAAS